MLEFFKKHKEGILGTLIFHGILALLFVFFGFSTPLPLPGEQGVMINFGNTRDASGAAEPQESVVQETSTQRESQPAQQEQQESQTPQEETPTGEEQDVATQDFEEAPAMDQKQEETQEQQEQENQPEESQQENQQQQEQEEETEPEREVNENALYPGKSEEESGENEGETEGSGNQGQETGSPSSDNYSDEDSQGMGGIDFSLKGRNSESLPKPAYNYEVEGKVVVEITVDTQGNVTNAVSGVKGSTTLNDKLLDAAKKAALKAKFDSKSDAPAYQKGTITYYFRLE
ncbi:MAG: TonB family protein [Bacteroidota bacterium]